MCQHNLSPAHFTGPAAGGGHASDEPQNPNLPRVCLVTCSKAALNGKCFQKAVAVTQRSSSEQMTLSNGQGIKYSASSIRISQNLCVIRDNWGGGWVEIAKR